MKLARPITLPVLTPEERAAFYPPVSITRVYQHGGDVTTTEREDGSCISIWEER